jgi:signal recognition particle GTPase
MQRLKNKLNLMASIAVIDTVIKKRKEKDKPTCEWNMGQPHHK